MYVINRLHDRRQPSGLREDMERLDLDLGRPQACCLRQQQIADGQGLDRETPTA
jgi:hypothetical protein